MIEISLSELDRERFGAVTAKCRVRSLEDVANIDAWCHERGVEFVITRTGTENLRIAHCLEDHGHRLMDTLVYFRRAFGIEPLAPPTLPDRYRLCEERRPTPAEMKRIAALSFQDYGGHYHADPRIDSAAADAAYVSWAERSADSAEVAQRIVCIWHVATDGSDELAAFATLNDAGADCEGVLFGVHPSHQSLGLHRALLRASLVDAHRRGRKAFFSSTQLTNLQVQRNWAREGLLPSHSLYTFHQWRVR